MDTFAKLEDGRIVEYTEMCHEERPSGNVDDYVLLGKGDFDHLVGTAPKNAVEIKSDVLISRSIVSAKKFDLLKIHSSLPEKFKPKSPRNIFKKRPYGYF